MTQIKGVGFGGINIAAKASYQSIAPGLKYLIDCRQRITKVLSEVDSWADKSIKNTLIKASTPTRRVQTDGLFIKGNNVNEYLNSPTKDYKFLHTGGAFGMYGIARLTWSLASPSTGILFETSPSVGTGLQQTMGSNISSGRYGYTMRGGASLQVRTINNLLIPTINGNPNPNYSPSGQLHIFSFVNLGNNAGIRIRFGNGLLDTTPFFTDMAHYPTGEQSRFNLLNGNSSLVIELANNMIYDWKGKTFSETLQYDAHIYGQLLQDKIEFNYLNSLL